MENITQKDIKVYLNLIFSKSILNSLENHHPPRKYKCSIIIYSKFIITSKDTILLSLMLNLSS